MYIFIYSRRLFRPPELNCLLNDSFFSHVTPVCVHVCIDDEVGCLV